MKKKVLVVLIIFAFIILDGFILYQHNTIQNQNRILAVMNKQDHVLYSKVKSLENRLKEMESSAIRKPPDAAALPLCDEDFIIYDKNNYIPFDSEYKNLVTSDKLVKSVPANEIHAYDTYVYENFTISVGITIDSIHLTTPKLKTSRGIRIGDKISKVLMKYGDTDMKISDYDEELDIPESYTYYYDGNYIKFFVDKKSNIVGIDLDGV